MWKRAACSTFLAHFKYFTRTCTTEKNKNNLHYFHMSLVSEMRHVALAQHTRGRNTACTHGRHATQSGSSVTPPQQVCQLVNGVGGCGGGGLRVLAARSGPVWSGCREAITLILLGCKQFHPLETTDEHLFWEEVQYLLGNCFFNEAWGRLIYFI